MQEARGAQGQFSRPRLAGANAAEGGAHFLGGSDTDRADLVAVIRYWSLVRDSQARPDGVQLTAQISR